MMGILSCFCMMACVRLYPMIRSNRTLKVYRSTAVRSPACYETILLSKSGEKVDSVPYRKDTFAAQAPQSFRLKDIIAAHDEVRAINPSYENMVDACTIMTTLGKEVHMISGNRGNIKVTIYVPCAAQLQRE